MQTALRNRITFLSSIFFTKHRGHWVIGACRRDNRGEVESRLVIDYSDSLLRVLKPPHSLAQRNALVFYPENGLLQLLLLSPKSPGIPPLRLIVILPEQCQVCQSVLWAPRCPFGHRLRNFSTPCVPSGESSFLLVLFYRHRWKWVTAV